MPGIFAAGDVANFFDTVFKERRRIEHWDNAVKQGRLAARNMLGRRLAYEEVSYFFCNILDLSFNFLGSTREIDQRIGRGSLEDRSFALFYLKNNVLCASFSDGAPGQRDACDGIADPSSHQLAFRERKACGSGLCTGKYADSDRSNPAGWGCAGCLRMRGGASAR